MHKLFEKCGLLRRVGEIIRINNIRLNSLDYEPGTKPDANFHQKKLYVL